MSKPRRRLSTDDRHAELLQQGLKIFATEPYESVSIERIATAAGISTGLLYHYFPSKKALFIATYQTIAEQFLNSFSPQPGQSPWQIIAQGIDQYLEFAEKNPAAISLFLRPSLAGDTAIFEINQKINEQILVMLVAGLAISPDNKITVLAIRAWLAFLDKAVLDWLAESGLDKAEIKGLALKTLAAILQQ